MAVSQRRPASREVIPAPNVPVLESNASTRSVVVPGAPTVFGFNVIQLVPVFPTGKVTKFVLNTRPACKIRSKGPLIYPAVVAPIKILLVVAILCINKLVDVVLKVPRTKLKAPDMVTALFKVIPAELSI